MVKYFEYTPSDKLNEFLFNDDEETDGAIWCEPLNEIWEDAFSEQEVVKEKEGIYI